MANRITLYHRLNTPGFPLVPVSVPFSRQLPLMQKACSLPTIKQLSQFAPETHLVLPRRCARVRPRRVHGSESSVTLRKRSRAFPRLRRKSVWTRGPETRQQLSRFRRVLVFGGGGSSAEVWSGGTCSWDWAARWPVKV
jgi:hypothetical protein